MTNVNLEDAKDISENGGNFGLRRDKMKKSLNISNLKECIERLESEYDLICENITEEYISEFLISRITLSCNINNSMLSTENTIKKAYDAYEKLRDFKDEIKKVELEINTIAENDVLTNEDKLGEYYCIAKIIITI